MWIKETLLKLFLKGHLFQYGEFINMESKDM